MKENKTIIIIIIIINSVDSELFQVNIFSVEIKKP